MRADSLDPDSDLGDRLVTLSVDRLAAEEVVQALAKALQAAEEMCRAGLIHGAVLVLQAEVRVVGAAPAGLLAT